MRPHLLPNSNVSQALGTVTVGSVVSLQPEIVDRELSQQLLLRAGAMTADLRHRIGRGEAHRQSQALASGQFDQGAPAATVEISNHGVYQTAPGACVALGQRFDGYEGLSVLVHSESDSGMLWLSASVGPELGQAAVLRMLERAAALIELCGRHDHRTS
eukprot:TRINITY_DN39067_c0_g1_i1.p1 TRINITY_DN39067_c0_g1~~TRINITY_DN39067_c0_g1_i1.p1  ORF type:complete len:159 (-),score=26.88 TRINITY_DN39067_c0_g1_i1:59-535(-)